MDLFSDNINFESIDTITRLFKESRAGFLQLFNNSPVCMSMTTTTLGRRVYRHINKKFIEKFGYTEMEIIGHTSIEVGILDKDESERVRMIIKDKGRLQNDYVKCRAKDGHFVHTVSSIEIMEMNGETYLVSFFVDVTKIIEQQAIIEQHLQQLETANKELEAFSYSISHDLRAPLRAINGYARILEEDFCDVLDNEGKRILTAVQDNAIKMGKLIDSLLAFARLGKQAIIKTDIDMGELIDEVLIDLKKNTGHTADIQLSNLPPVQGDRTLIKQVVFNLISNSIKYSSKRECPVIEIASAINNDGITYTIKDNGEGFDIKYADKLFGVFHRLHTDDEFEGIGVGLAIVQRIVHKHGGTVYAAGELGKGAVFSFKLPM